MSGELDWREIAALKTFENRGIVRFHELPNYIGLGTMSRLVAKGLIEPVDKLVPAYSRDFRWKLTRAMEE